MKKSQERDMRRANSHLNLTTEGSVDAPNESSDESVYLDTQQLQQKLEIRKHEKSEIIKKMGAADKYKWKFSVIKHREWRQAWEVLIIVIALYSILVIPIRIAINTDLFGKAYDVIDLITWFFYAVDVGVNLRTTYIDTFGLEVTDSGKIMGKYTGSLRFILDILSLFNLPTVISKNFSLRSQLVLSTLGLLKISRYFRAQGLIVESRLKTNRKAGMSCCFYFVLLIIYLHMMGCLFFLFCLTTYEGSSFRMDVIDSIGLRVAQDDGSVTYPYPEYEPFYTAAEEAVAKKGSQAYVHAWVPAFDNYDGAEKFWLRYELSLLSQE